MHLVLTSHGYGEREVLEELGQLGHFWRTGFRDVIRGEVEDLQAFLQQVEGRGIRSVSRIVPIEKSFQFSPERAVEEFAQAAKPLIGRIRKGESFCVKVERRGLKGAFSSAHVAREVGAFLSAALKERDGVEGRVDLEDPNVVVVLETLGRWCGIGLISREMRKGHSYLKLP